MNVMRMAIGTLGVLLCLNSSGQRNPNQVRVNANNAGQAGAAGGFVSTIKSIPEPYGSTATACAMYGPLGPAFFAGSKMLVLPLSGGDVAEYDLAQIPGCPRELIASGIDAAVDAGDVILLFIGASYSEFDLINGTLSDMQPWPLPEGWKWVDGGVPWGEGSMLLSYGLEAVIYDGEAYSEPFSMAWPGWPETWNDGVDDMLAPGDGQIYFFRGGEASILSLTSQTMTGAPFPVSGGQQADYAPQPPGNDPGRTWGQNDGEPKPAEREPEKPTKPAIVDGYLDNYPDFSDSVGVEWAVMNKNTMPGLDWIGVGLDIVEADPLRWTSSPKKPKRAFAISISKQNVLGEPDKFLPYGTVYTTLAQGDGDDNSVVISNVQEYHRNLGGTIGGNVGVPNLAAFSASASMRNVTNSRIGEETALITRKDVRRMFRLELQPTWTAEKDAFGQLAGQRYRQKLAPEFRAAIAKLKVPGTVPEIGYQQMTKNGKLPPEVEALKVEYMNLLYSYGNYFVEKIEYGGRFTENYEMRKSEFMKSGQTFASYASSAQAVIKGISVGASQAYDVTIGSSEEETSSRISRTTSADGYNGSKDWNSWDASAQNPLMKPVPINISFLPLSDLLSRAFFPDDPDIEKKQRMLRMVIEQHLVNKAFDASHMADAEEWKSPHAGDAPRYYVVTFTKWVSDVDDSGSSAEFYGTVKGGLIYGGEVVAGTELTLWSKPGRNDRNCTVVSERGGEYTMNHTRTYCGQGSGFATGRLAIWGKMIESECAAAAYQTNWDPASEPSDDHFTEVTIENAQEKDFTVPLNALKLGAEPSTGKFTFKDGDSSVHWYYRIQRVRKEVLSDEDQKRCP